MQSFPGWIAKGGAEGLVCAASPDGLGVALKVEDGANARSGLPSARFLDTLGLGRLDLRLDPGSQQSRRSRRRSASDLKKVLHKAVDRC